MLSHRRKNSFPLFFASKILVTFRPETPRPYWSCALKFRKKTNFGKNLRWVMQHHAAIHLFMFPNEVRTEFEWKARDADVWISNEISTQLRNCSLNSSEVKTFSDSLKLILIEVESSRVVALYGSAVGRETLGMALKSSIRVLKVEIKKSLVATQNLKMKAHQRALSRPITWSWSLNFIGNRVDRRPSLRNLSHLMRASIPFISSCKSRLWFIWFDLQNSVNEARVWSLVSLH